MKKALIMGNNTLSICPATMQAVMKAWLEDELASPVQVKNVSWNGSSGGFDVKFERTEEVKGD